MYDQLYTLRNSISLIEYTVLGGKKPLLVMTTYVKCLLSIARQNWLPISYIGQLGGRRHTINLA